MNLDEYLDNEPPDGPVQNFCRFLTQAGPPSTKDNPTPKPWSAAVFAYIWGHTTHCPPEGTL